MTTVLNISKWASENLSLRYHVKIHIAVQYEIYCTQISDRGCMMGSNRGFPFF